MTDSTDGRTTSPSPSSSPDPLSDGWADLLWADLIERYREIMGRYAAQLDEQLFDTSGMIGIVQTDSPAVPPGTAIVYTPPPEARDDLYPINRRTVIIRGLPDPHAEVVAPLKHIPGGCYCPLGYIDPRCTGRTW